jgi:hypothetical protein
MEEIKKKIQELLDFSNTEPEKGKDYWDKLNAKMKHQDVLIAELLTLARANKTLLGRTIRFRMADSYALYVITKLNAKTVQLTWLDYCDAWVDDRVGKQGTVSLSYAKKQCDFDDMWAAQIAKKKENVQA